MSVDISAHSLKKIPSIKEFKEFLGEKVKENLKEKCHNLQFKQRGKRSLWVGCKGLWKRGCWFFFDKNSVCATTNAGRSGADATLQEVGISELVKTYGGEIFDHQSMSSNIFNKETNQWEKIEIEYTNSIIDIAEARMLHKKSKR